MGEKGEAAAAATATTREPHEASRREGRDSHGRRHHSSSSRSRREERSPKRRRDERRHEPHRSHHRSRAEESGKEGDHGHRPLQDAAPRDDSLREEAAKSLSDAKNGPPARDERSPRGTKRYPESREAWRPRSFHQHDERSSAGQGGRHYRQSRDYGRERDEKEHPVDREKHKADGHCAEGKVEQREQQKDGDSTWKHDGFFQLEEEAPLAKRKPSFKEMGMPLEGNESAPAGTETDPRSRKHDQSGSTYAMGEERRNYHTRGFDRYGGPFIKPDERAMRRGFTDHRSAGQRNGYDSRGRFAGRGRGRDMFNNPFDGRDNMYQDSGDQAEKWKHDLYDQTNRSPTPKTEEEQIAKVEALLAL